MPVLAFRRQVDRMASREGDISLWLHNKLGSTDDLWSGNSICSQLSRDKLLSIQDCFHNLQPYVKVKLMLSFLHLAKRNVEEWKVELEEILQLAQDDTDQWVAMVGDILKTFPASGGLNTDIDDQHSFFHEVLTDLRKLVKKSHDVGMLPLECHYLNRLALQSVAGQQPQPVKHFALKRKPKSAALRAEILQKSSEAANNLKKTGASSSVPVKFRSFAKKMDEENPPRSRGATGFLKSNSLSRSSFGGSHLGNRSASSRRDCGIKLLDIDEVPVGGREAKRRKKQAEQEALELQKKEKEAQSNTPDYAAGLMSPAVGTVLNAGASTSGPNYVPSTTRLPAANTGGTTILPTNSISLATQQARDHLQQQLQQQLAPAQQQQQQQQQQQPPSQQQQQQQQQPPQQQQQQQQPQQGVVVKVVTSVPQPSAAAPPTVTQQVVNSGQGQGQVQAAQQQPKRGLSLTREQMLEAQEMFKNSNKVTRPEKALILGFMAGARDNPCPQQGDIVNIRLSEALESVQQPDMMFRPMMVDSFFQMNYSTGEWKRIKKYRVPDPE